MDNRKIEGTSAGDQALALAMTLAWAGVPGGKATHYKVVQVNERTTYYGAPTERHATALHEAATGTPTLLLLWHEERDALPLASPMGSEAAAQFASEWLRVAGPNVGAHDEVETDSGWRLLRDEWAGVVGYRYAIAAVQPVVALFGK